MEFIQLLFIGVLVGFISAFFGVGGGIVMVPLLNLFYPALDQQFIIATSLSVIFINSILNTYNFSKRVRIHWQLIFIMASASVISAFITAEFAQGIDSRTLKIIFIGFITIVACLLLFKSSKESKPKTLSKTHITYALVIGALSGFISAITGLGGGAIIVPLMIYLLQIESHKLSAFSNAVMIFTTLSGCLSYGFSTASPIDFHQIGYILPMLSAGILFGSFFGSRIGVKMNQKVNPLYIKKSFALLLLIVATRMTFKLI